MVKNYTLTISIKLIINANIKYVKYVNNLTELT